MRVFVTGASGLLGSRVCRRLCAKGFEIVALSRRPQSGVQDDAAAAFRWVRGDPVQAGPWLEEAVAADAVVHLAGEPIAGGRWTRARKRRLVESRVKSTTLIAAALREAGGDSKTLINASAVGYYGSRGEEECTEQSPPGDDFLARLCRDWERAGLRAECPTLRVVCLRFGVILSLDGGALAKLLPPFRMGLGGPIGPAERWFPWIHESDAVGFVERALVGSPQWRGVVNAVAPEPARMGEFASTLGRALGRPARFPIPLAVLRLALGEAADALNPGQKILPARALEDRYVFAFPGLAAALRDLVG